MTDENDISKDLLIAALRQRIGELTQNYEYKIAEIRVEYTLLENDYNLLQKEIESKEAIEDRKNEFPSVDELVEANKSV